MPRTRPAPPAIADDDRPTPDEIRVRLMRAIAAKLDRWPRCPHQPCRRAKACVGPEFQCLEL